MNIETTISLNLLVYSTLQFIKLCYHLLSKKIAIHMQLFVKMKRKKQNKSNILSVRGNKFTITRNQVTYTCTQILKLSRK